MSASDWLVGSAIRRGAAAAFPTNGYARRARRVEVLVDR